jgi:hypothetical protein
MPKAYEFPLDENQVAWMFKPLRSKADVLYLLMKTIKFMLLSPDLTDPKSVAGKLVLHVDRMSRLFFQSDKKIFSIALPFFVREEDGRLTFSDPLHPVIDSKVTSDIISLLESGVVFSTPDVYVFLDEIHPLSNFDSDIWQFFRKLLLAEDGYIRYDLDEAHVDGHRHPLHHLDIFYGSQSTFKLGLYEQIDAGTFLDILDVTTDCHYAAPPGA